MADDPRHDADGAGPTVFRVDLEHTQWLTPLTVTWLADELRAEFAHLEVEGKPDLAGFGVRATVTDPGARTPGLARRSSEPLGDYHLFAISRHT